MGQTARRPGAARAGRGDRTRAALVTAALELFDAKGVEATAVDEITAAAHVAKGTFYVHFQRKQDVLLEHAAALVADLARPPLPDDPIAQLRTLVARVAAALSQMPRALTGRAIREVVGNRDAWVRVLGERPTMAAVLAPVVAQGQERGELRDDLSPARLGQALTILLLDGVIGWSEAAVERPLDVLLERLLGLFLDGALPR